MQILGFTAKEKRLLGPGFQDLYFNYNTQVILVVARQSSLGFSSINYLTSPGNLYLPLALVLNSEF